MQYQGAGSPPFLMPVYPANPGIFTSGKGSGQAAAVNQDGLLNDANHPAPAGTIILLYATGEGQTAPTGVDGQVTVPPWPKPLLPVSVTIGGQPAEVLYAGEAPGEIAGVMQLNVRIPGGIPPGSAVPVAISVGGTPNIMQQVTIAVSAGIE